MNSHRSMVKGASASNIEEIDTLKPETSKLSYLKDMSEENINKDKMDKRYKLMMEKLHDCQLKAEPEERIKSARAIKDEFSNEFKKIGKTEKKEAEEEAKDLVAELAQIEPKKNVIKAPNELLEEFLVYVMQKDYPNALKLCGFILIYEPHNALAKEYLPLLENKVLQIEERGESTSGESSSSDSDLTSSDEESSSDDSSTDSDSGSGDSKKEQMKKREPIKKNEASKTKALGKISEDDDDDDVKIPDSISTTSKKTKQTSELRKRKDVKK